MAQEVTVPLLPLGRKHCESTFPAKNANRQNGACNQSRSRDLQHRPKDRLKTSQRFPHPGKAARLKRLPVFHAILIGIRYDFLQSNVGFSTFGSFNLVRTSARLHARLTKVPECFPH